MNSNVPFTVIVDNNKNFMVTSDWLVVLRGHVNYGDVASWEVDGLNGSLNLPSHSTPQTCELVPAPNRASMSGDPFPVFGIESRGGFAIMHVSSVSESGDQQPYRFLVCLAGLGGAGNGKCSHRDGMH